MQLIPGTTRQVEHSLGSCGLVKGASTAADISKSHIASQVSGHVDDLVCLVILIVLRNCAGEGLAGGHPITVELLDWAGRVVVAADNAHLVSGTVSPTVNQVHTI